MRTGGQAFPRAAVAETGSDINVPGMTLRDWFAGQALSGLCGARTGASRLVVALAYEHADAMLAEREQK